MGKNYVTIPMYHSWERITSFAPWVTHGIELRAFIARKMLKSMHNMWSYLWKILQSLVRQIHFWELLQIGVIQKSLLVKRPRQKSYEDVRFIGQDHGNVLETVLHAHLINPVKRQCFSKIASHISEVGGSHGHNVVNGFKVLCGDAPAVSLVGIVKGFTVQDAEFIDTHCNRSAAQNRASWWLQPSTCKCCM